MNWVIQNAPKTKCKECLNPVDLLCRNGMKLTPAFYICWFCRSIAQVGYGPIKDEREDGSKLNNDQTLQH